MQLDHSQYDESDFFYDDFKLFPAAVAQIASMRWHVGSVTDLRSLNLTCGERTYLP